MKKLLAFDFDGTIIDSFQGFLDSTIEYSELNNLPIPCLNTIKIGYGEPHKYDFGWGVDKDAQYEHLIGAFNFHEEIEVNRPDRTPILFAKARETLTRLKDDGHTLAIVTARPRESLMKILDTHKLTELFSGFRTFNDREERGEGIKPEPDQLLSVIKELGFKKEHTLMVGDTTMDIEMANRAGVRSIGVTWGSHTHEHLLGVGAHNIIGDCFSEVGEVIDAIINK